MKERFGLPLGSLVLLTLTLLTVGCATTMTVLPGKSLALIEVQYPESRMTGIPMAPGEDSATTRMARAILREIEREGFYQITDVRNLGVHASSLGKDEARTSALIKQAPADAYVGIRLLDCAARPMSATETRGTGPSAVTVTVYWYRGECTAELEAFEAGGKKLTILQKTGRWESPRQERRDESSMQSQALTLAVDDTARRLAREIRPTAGATK